MWITSHTVFKIWRWCFADQLGIGLSEECVLLGFWFLILYEENKIPAVENIYILAEYCIYRVHHFSGYILFINSGLTNRLWIQNKKENPVCFHINSFSLVCNFISIFHIPNSLIKLFLIALQRFIARFSYVA